ncbi:MULTISPECIES: DUF2891 domain-containing protein [Myroides]|uniref:DUF2891 family protein n=1 Tax=Myroides albus TaxID=2562892 RepID=A0A6I3LFJ3_9FLAO|nr:MULTISPECIES: DUF2891 domain-containing protein [Myroides]MTG96677.1 DUF2891 family protein [Myroides albus]MVX34689.1 DUF2891 family protein [Myroides sp. LoEW2-1]UVD80911.1 DUF2891 domain-containing protein [Myroides albus]
MKYIGLIGLVCLGLIGCDSKEGKQKKVEITDIKSTKLGVEEAQKIIELPLHCIELEYPNRLGQTLGSDSDLKTPKTLRPIFYGCYDWHSSVHGFWSIVVLMQKFPELDKDGEIRNRLNRLITKENLAVELAFFDDVNNKSFERTYGWAWFFELHSALLQWEDEDAQRWARVLQPLADKLVDRYEEYLPKLLYPIRTGTHNNSAFGLSLALEYARNTNNSTFEQVIIESSKRLYEKDIDCSLSYEPSGSDFLSPCFEEARLMSKVLTISEFEHWLKAFLPSIFESNFSLDVAQVSDRTDGQLVHLDGLNFSRATCLYDIAKQVPSLTEVLLPIADKHFDSAFKNISGDDYMGSHWLGSFALYTLLHK